jgi:hypothetical protein
LTRRFFAAPPSCGLPHTWSAKQTHEWVRGVLDEAGLRVEGLEGRVAVAGKELMGMSRGDLVELLSAPAGQVVFNRLAALRDSAAQTLQGSHFLSRVIADHARLVAGDAAALSALATPAEQREAEAFSARMRALLRDTLAFHDTDGRFITLDSALKFVERGAEALAALPRDHPLALKEGRYVWTAQRRGAVRRIVSALLARSQGFQGTGGVHVALSDVRGSGKSTTVKLVAVLASFMLPRLVAFVFRCRDGVARPSELYRTAFLHRRGTPLPVAEVAGGLSTAGDFHALPPEVAVPFCVLDEADLLWREGEVRGSEAAAAVNELYQLAAQPGPAMLVLAGDSRRLSGFIRGEFDATRFAPYPRGLGADRFEVLRLGGADSEEELRALVAALRDAGAVAPTVAEPYLASAERLRALQFETGGIPRLVASVLLDDSDKGVRLAVQLPPPDHLHMALLLALRHKYHSLTRAQRVASVFDPPALEEPEAMSINRAFYSQGAASASATGAAASAPPSHEHADASTAPGPALILRELERMEDQYMLKAARQREGGSGGAATSAATQRRWQLLFPRFMERVETCPLAPLADAAPALFLDPFWRRGPERLLRDAFEARSVVFVLGAGVSMASCARAPSWWSLIGAAAERLPAEQRALVEAALVRDNDAVKAASLVQSLMPQEKFAAFFRDSFASLRVTDGSLLRAIGEWRVPVITCNYDTSFEQVWPDRRVAKWTDAQLPVAEMLRGEPVVLHVHGRYDDVDSLVFGSASYDRILRCAQLQELLRALHTQQRTLVYLGFGGGLDDPNFGRLLRWADEELADADFRQYVLMRHDDAERWAREERHRRRQQKTHTIPIVYGRDFSDLPGFVRTLKRSS